LRIEPEQRLDLDHGKVVGFMRMRQYSWRRRFPSRITKSPGSARFQQSKGSP
jgi:hypothetical protein